MDFQHLQPNFGFAPLERIRHTIDHTTQFAHWNLKLPMKESWKTQFPACNVPQLNEDVATDLIFSDIPAGDDGIDCHGGCEMVQFFIGIKTLLKDAMPQNHKSSMPASLHDFICKWGAPNVLFCDNAKEQISAEAKEIL